MEQKNNPGAWERQLHRHLAHPAFFTGEPPDAHSLEQARQRDQQELGEFHQRLAALVSGMTEADFMCKLPQLKRDLDKCYDDACSLCGDLSDQKAAISNLNEIVTGALRRALRDDDEHGRLQLIKQESLRNEKLQALQHPLIADLLRTPSPIAKSSLAASLAGENLAAFRLAIATIDGLESNENSDDAKQSILGDLLRIRNRCGQQIDRALIDEKISLLQQLCCSAA